MLHARFNGLCAHIAKNGEQADVIVLQEVGHAWERPCLVDAGKAGGLCHARFFNQAIGLSVWPDAFGTGLVVLSRWPIVSSQYNPYAVNGKPLKIHHCDYYGAKGIAHVQLAVPPAHAHGQDAKGGMLLDVVTTHTHADYTDTKSARASGDVDEYATPCHGPRHTHTHPLSLSLSHTHTHTHHHHHHHHWGGCNKRA